VTLTQGFYLGKYELTQEQWTLVMGTNPWEGSPGFARECARCPAVNRNWNEYQLFIQRLNEENTDLNFRLPTEAEWEYAAKAGTTTTWPFGDSEEELGDYAWYEVNSGCVNPSPDCMYHEVGLKKPNPWGLYDMYGNAWEWTVDFWRRQYTAESQVDIVQHVPMTDSEKVLRVYKGGSFWDGPQNVRPAKRNANELGGWNRLSIRLVAQPHINTSITPMPWG
jgi:formylglycine-generating enzyme required for sulfatase activity